MKKAYLVYVGFVTRVIVDENATDEEIIAAAEPKFVENMQADLQQSIEKIEEDTECPVLGLDKNGNPIETGDDVDVPAPNADDNYSNEFTGTVTGKRKGYIQVEDGEGNTFEIEPERLTLSVDDRLNDAQIEKLKSIVGDHFTTPEQ